MLEAIPLTNKALLTIATRVDRSIEQILYYVNLFPHTEGNVSYIVVDPTKSEPPYTIYMNSAFHNDYVFYEDDETELAFRPIVRKEIPSTEEEPHSSGNSA